jgi:phosphoadenosine phosphosulfate reductase
LIDKADIGAEAAARTLLADAWQRFGNRFAIVTSFQSEGMVLVDMAARISPEIRVLTLDTGRLHQATLDLIAAVEQRYGIGVDVVRPDPDEVASMTGAFGANLFREGVAHRMLCCQIRKVRPLERALFDVHAWASGLRREQAESRRDIAVSEEIDGRLKLNPLAGWTHQQVEDYTAAHDVPRHPLYAQGYATIGCEPCTRAIQAGEDARAGRWWWESDAGKECGIHFSPDGRAERTVDVLLREVLSVPR